MMTLSPLFQFKTVGMEVLPFEVRHGKGPSEYVSAKASKLQTLLESN
jgi:hypothetical protein